MNELLAANAYFQFDSTREEKDLTEGKQLTEEIIHNLLSLFI